MFTPYVYQADCLTVLDQVHREDTKRALVVMATALGKTVTAAFDVKAWLVGRPKGSRVLYLCHQNEILYQAKITFQSILGHGHTYGYFHGQEKTAHAVDVLFASLQTMEEHKKSFSPDEFDYVIVDESHHSQAESYKSTIQYFTPEFLLGMTATPDRLDELDIREIFGEEVFSLPLEEAMAKGYLAPVDYRLLTDEIQLSKFVETEKGRMGIAQLNRMLFIPRRDEEIATIIAKHISGIENPRVIIFCSSVKHCNHLAEIIPDSFAIHTRIPQKERDVRMEMFRQGLIGTVLVVDSFNEGVDVPSANVIVFLRGTSSRNIFFQQLGRGLRRAEGKIKVIVLDFVSNCERIGLVTALQEEVRKEYEHLLHRLGIKNESEKEKVPMTLNIESAEFQEKIIPILRMLTRASADFYLTWQEASKATRVLGITSKEEYSKNYLSDIRLPSSPHYNYGSDFPGWPVFLGKRKEKLYQTWQEASKAAKKLGITTVEDYKKRYKEDPKLPADPPTFRGCPGWTIFFGRELKEFYPTWKEVSEVCKNKNIKSGAEYFSLCDKDSKLPRDPYRVYPDFPGFAKAFGLKKLVENPYPTWQEASKAAKKLGIKSSVKYEKEREKDPRLYAMPTNMYQDFPGWATFLGIPEREFVKDPYPDWASASAAAQALGIKSSTEYHRRRKEDSRLPSFPPRYEGFPGWAEFLGKKD